jgi:SnoaL-like domain
VSETGELSRWMDKLEIREIIERSVRYIDDQDGKAFADLFEEDGVMQLSGTLFDGRQALRDMFRGAGGRSKWTEPGELLKQPGVMHLTTNPVIDVEGDSATAETDMITLRRDEDGRVKITLLARYRDRLRRADDGRWLISSRTGVSIAIAGDEGTDAEWARALAKMPEDVRARFRVEG